MKISIIIVNYNTKKILQDCLESIFTQSKQNNFELIVVDNGSTDGSKIMIKNKFSKAVLIDSNENLGFGKANNLGAKKARGEWLLFLNSDTKLDKYFINKLEEEIDNLGNKNIVLGCQLLNKDGSIQASAGYFPTIIRVATQMFFIDDLLFFKKFIKPYQQNDLSFYNKKREVDWVTGAFMLMLKRNFNKVGGFDENIFMYGEEVELCYRLKRNGIKIIFNPTQSIYHLKGKSSPDGFESAVLGEFQGLITFYKKYYNSQISYLKFCLKLGALLRIAVFGMINSRKVKAYQKAIKLI